MNLGKKFNLKSKLKLVSKPKLFKRAALLCSCSLLIVASWNMYLTYSQQQGGQVITSGDFSFLQIPQFVGFPSIETSPTQTQFTVWSYETSTTQLPSDDRHLLVVEDLRDDGGFRIDAELVQFETASGTPLDLQEGSNGGGALYVATQAPGNFGNIETINGVGYDLANTGPKDVNAPQDLAGADSEDSGNYFTNFVDPVTILNGPVDIGIGRTGQFAVSVNYMAEIQPFTPPGTYELLINFTAYEASTGEAPAVLPDPFDPQNDDISLEVSNATLLMPPSIEQINWGVMTLSETDVVDWFAIDLIANEQLLLDATSTLGTVSALLCEDTECLNPVLNNTPTTSGRYFIRVLETSTGDAQYSLTYSYAIQSADDWDTLDDDCQDATALNFVPDEEQYHGLHTLSATDTEDWFEFTTGVGASAIGEYNFNSIISNGHAQIDIYDDCNGAPILSNSSSGGIGYESSYFDLTGYIVDGPSTLAPETTYYIRVSSVNPSDSVSYNFYYAFTNFLSYIKGESADDEFDHGTNGGDDLISGDPYYLTYGENESPTGRTLTPSDTQDLYLAADSFAFGEDLEAGIVYNFEALNVYGDLQLLIYDSSFNLVDTSTNLSGAFNHDFEVPYNDTFYLLVKAHPDSNGLIAEYDLQYENLGVAPPPDSNEPDNSGIEATLLNVTDQLQFSDPHSLSATDLEDWFAFELIAGNTYEFYTSGNSDTTCYLYSDIDGLVQENDDLADDDAGNNLNCRTVFIPTSTQTYYYKITEYSGDTASYSFYYQMIAEASEVNDDLPHTGHNLGSPTEHMQLGVSKSLSATNTVDWYKFDLQAGRVYNFNTIGSTGNLALNLYSSVDAAGNNGVQVALGSNGYYATSGAVNIDYKAEATHTYYLRVATNPSGGDVDYTLKYKMLKENFLDPNDPEDDSYLSGFTGQRLFNPHENEVTHVERNISGTDIFDYYSVNLRSGKQYNFNTVGSAGKPIFLEIFNGSSAVASGLGDLSFTAPSTVSYLLRVRTDVLGGYATYQLKYSCTLGCATDSYEPYNDRPLTGGVEIIPAVNMQTSANHTISSESNLDTIDWFKMNLDEGKTYNFNSIGSTGNLQARLYSGINDADSGFVEVTADTAFSGGDGAFNFDYTAPRSQEYYLRISTTSVSATYDLNYKTVEISAEIDEIDPVDDTRITGFIQQELFRPTTSVITHSAATLSSSDLFDYYSVNLTNGKTYNFNTAGSTGSDIKIDIMSGSTVQASGVGTVTYVASGGGVRNIRIRTDAIGGNADYELKYNCSAGCSQDAYEPYNDRPLSGGVVLNSPSLTMQTSSNHTLSDIDVIDWFKIDLETGKTYNFNSIGSSGNLHARLYSGINDADSGFIEVATDTVFTGGSGAFNFDYTAASTQTYYLRITTTSGSGSYDLKYKLIEAQVGADEIDPVDDSAVTGFVPSRLFSPATAETEHAQMTLSSSDLYDYYSVSLTTGKTYNFNTSGSTGADLRIDIMSGSTIQASGTGTVNYVASGTGTRNIRIRTNPVGQSATYSLKYSCSSGCTSDAFDPNNDRPHLATLLPNPTLVEQSNDDHTLSNTDTSDWFRVQLIGGNTYNFNSTGSTGDIYATLYSRIDDLSSNGLAVASHYVSGPFNFNYTPTYTQIYYLRVQTQIVGNNASYDLKYSLTSESPNAPLAATDDYPLTGNLLVDPVLDLQTTAADTLSGGDPRDWYIVYLEEGKTYNFNSIGSSGNVYGELYASINAFGDNGHLVTSDYNYFGGSGAFNFDYTAFASQYYYLRIREASVGNSNYQLNYKNLGKTTATDLSDPNDDSYLSLSTYARQRIFSPAVDEVAYPNQNLSGPDNFDYYNVYLYAGKTYEFNTDIISGGDAHLAIFNSDATSILQSGVNTFTYTPPSNAERIIRVRANTFGGASEYSLRYSCTSGCIADSDDPENDYPFTGNTLNTPTAAMQTYATRTLSDSDQNDWYKVYLQAGKTYNFNNIGSSTPSGNYIAYLYSSVNAPFSVGTAVVGETLVNGGSGTFNFDYTPAISQTYFLRVTRSVHTGTATYALNYKVLEKGFATDTIDSGDDSYLTTFTRQFLYPPAQNSITHDERTLNDKDLFDYYTINLTAGKTYNFTAATLGGDVVIDLLSNSGSPSAVLATSAANSLTYASPSTTIRFIRVRASEIGGERSYELSYSCTVGCSDTDDFAPLDDVPLTASVLPEATVALQSTSARKLTDTDHEDWYKIYLEGGKTYNFNTIGSTDGSYYGRLYSSVNAQFSGGTVVASDMGLYFGGSGDFNFDYTAALSQDYYLRVSRPANTGVGTYQLNYKLVTDGQDQDLADPMDDSYLAAFTRQQLYPPANSGVTHEAATLSATDNFDYYSVALVNGKTYNFTANVISGDNVIVDVLSNSSNPSAILAGGASNTVNYASNGTLTRYIRVRTETFGGTSNYELQYSCTLNCSSDADDPVDDRPYTGTTLNDPTNTLQTDAGHTLSDTDHNDWYKVNLESGETYNFNSTGSSGDLYVQLYSTVNFAGSSGNAVAAHTVAGAFDLNHSPSLTQQYYLRVYRPSNVGTASYDLKYTCTSCP